MYSKGQLLITAVLCLLALTMIPTQVMSSSAGTSYTYKGGDWADTACETGTKQSPIDFPLEKQHVPAHNTVQTSTHYPASTGHRILSSGGTTAAVPLTFTPNSHLKIVVSQDPMANVTVTDLGTTYQVGFKLGSLAFWGHEGEMELFNVLQFHLHSPSEHTFDGKNYDLELHIVHQSYDQTALAVIGIFFDVEVGGDEDNEFITALNVAATRASSVKTWNVSSIPLTNLLNKLDTSEIFHYSGSLTTPPCSEVVNWIVIHDVQPISTKQLAYFNKKWMANSTFANGNGNNRATQPLGDRTIYYLGTNANTIMTGFACLIAMLCLMISL